MKDSNKIIKILSEQEIVKEVDFLKKAFSKVGNFLGKEETPPTSKKEDGGYKLKRISEHVYMFGNNSISYLEIFGNMPERRYAEYISENLDNFKWLFEGKFYAQYLAIDARSGSVVKFVGQWMGGTFSQGVFSSSSNRIDVDPTKLGFYGGDFNGGEFYLPYEYWRAKPVNFIGGKIKYTQNGLLGLKNVVNGIIEEPTNLIQIPEGKYLIIKLQGSSKLHVIRMLKRINEKDDNFAFSYGENTSYVPWEAIRSKFDSFYLFPGKINFVIPGIVKLDGKIETIEVTDNIHNIGQKQLGTRKKGGKYFVNLNNLPQVFGNIKDSIEIEPTSDQISFIHDLSSDFNENKGKVFLSHLDNIINEMILSGRGFNPQELEKNGLNYISKLLVNVSSLSEAISSEDLKSLKYINNFLLLMKNSGKIKEIYASIVAYMKNGLYGHEIKPATPTKEPKKEPKTMASIKKDLSEALKAFLKENEKK